MCGTFTPKVDNILNEDTPLCNDVPAMRRVGSSVGNTIYPYMIVLVEEGGLRKKERTGLLM
jgi:hypothetical protein